MSGLLEMLNSPMGRQLINGVAGETGQPENKTADVLSMALPLLLGAMKKNVTDPNGAEGLMNALSSRHDGAILDDLEGLFKGGVDTNVLEDGNGILGHVLGSKQPVIANALSQKSGLDADTIARILKIAAPIILGYLGRQRAKGNVNNANALNGLLGSMLGGQPPQNQNLIASLIDSDGDGSVLDDVADMVLGTSKKDDSLNGLLGGLFGK